jgi:hypothetical protein
MVTSGTMERMLTASVMLWRCRAVAGGGGGGAIALGVRPGRPCALLLPRHASAYLLPRARSISSHGTRQRANCQPVQCQAEEGGLCAKPIRVCRIRLRGDTAL